MKLRINLKYLSAFIVVLIVETLIALFVHDSFIRPHLGDVLVVVLIYLFIRSFVRNRIRLLPLYIFIFATAVEIGQYFHLAELLGVDSILFLRIILGSTFDIRDIACYLVGCSGLVVYEWGIAI